MYEVNKNRYENQSFYKRCGDSGILLPRISLGLWHNFGSKDDYQNSKNMMFKAFDLGINHFDVANTYGPPKGSAEQTLGKILSEELSGYRNELLIATKAGFDMWEGPYGNWGSRKYMLSSLDESLKRLKLDYVDIFYSHRPDKDTPLEETMNTLSDAVKSGKAMYIGISNYSPQRTARAIKILKDNKTPCLIHQMKYSILKRGPEDGLFDVLKEKRVGGINYSPLAQGLFTTKYLNGEVGRLSKEITPEMVTKLNSLNNIAAKRGQTLSQMAIAWTLKHPAITSTLIGASRPEQIEDNLKSLNNIDFSESELSEINNIMA